MPSLYKCDSCPAAFTFEQVAAAARPNTTAGSFNILTPGLCFVFLSKDNKPMGGSAMPGPDDKILHCPKCGRAHLFGFDRVNALNSL